MFSVKNLIVITLALYLILYILKDDNQKMIVFGIVILFLCMGDKLLEGLENDDNSNGFTDEKDDNGDSIVGNNTVSAGGAKPGLMGDPKVLNMGPYDGIVLKTGNEECWMKSPSEIPLVPNDGLYTYLSSQGPIKMKLSDQAALNGPPVDGVKGSVEKMFMWANNVTSPSCCPSTFSTSTGCVCSTKNQRDFIAARGMLEGSESSDEIEVS
tara:strand:- start:483 stop:1115 length:633 start_codon:yes stop_codon:yes gene_type:complete